MRPVQDRDKAAAERGRARLVARRRNAGPERALTGFEACREAAMGKSPEEPTGSAVQTDSLPWAPSPGSQDPLESATAAAEGFTDEPTSAEEAIGGGSHSSGEPPAEAAPDTLERAILAQPLAAVGIAAAAGFLAAVLLRR